ncbi:MAG: RNA polymerase sigma factor [Flavobacteriaceae bacterium]|nr:RNA polymerase sigma factor [Flavobacteriaceae bacterium]
MTEEQLVETLRQGSQEAFSYLYDNYSQTLYGVIYRMINDDNTAQDILQDSFVKIWKNIANYDESKGRLYIWMLNVARNQCIDTMRSKAYQNSQKNQNVEDAVHAVDKTNRTVQNPEIIGLKQQVMALKKDQRELIDLVYFNGLIKEQAAKQLKIPTGTVKTRIRAALLQLRKVYMNGLSWKSVKLIWNSITKNYLLRTINDKSA